MRTNREVRRGWAKALMVRPLRDELIELGIDDDLKCSEAAYDEAGRAMAELRISEELAGINTPTLIVAGDRDFLRAANLEDAQRIPNCALHVFYRVGHNIPFDVPEEFVARAGRLHPARHSATVARPAPRRHGGSAGAHSLSELRVQREPPPVDRFAARQNLFPLSPSWQSHLSRKREGESEPVADSVPSRVGEGPASHQGSLGEVSQRGGVEDREWESIHKP
ncbi:MAG: alpha/beta fold hydrolase [Dehalococcoidia bacterium]